MSLQIGIVGLPNVGKSTLFNALTRSESAQAANYPFCTIDPNIGIVEVPDDRLKQITAIVKPEKTIPAAIEFVDIAGLVKGASTGEGLGNQFLSHIRECNAIAQVIRVFADGNVIHVNNQINPKEDREIIETEIILADLQTIEKHLSKAKNSAKSGKKEDIAYAQIIEKLAAQLAAGQPARVGNWNEEELAALKHLHLLTMKPLMYIANLDENQIGKLTLAEIKSQTGLREEDIIIPINAKVEQDLASFSEEEAEELLKELGLEETGLKKLISNAYDLLGLQTYFTAGPKEVRAWTIKKGHSAPKAAGVIHSDFEKGFIRADVYDWNHLIEHRSEAKIREKGLLRSEGKDYIVKDGDIMHFHFNS